MHGFKTLNLIGFMCLYTCGTINILKTIDIYHFLKYFFFFLMFFGNSSLYGNTRSLSLQVSLYLIKFYKSAIIQCIIFFSIFILIPTHPSCISVAHFLSLLSRIPLHKYTVIYLCTCWGTIFLIPAFIYFK